ncbi:MAG TPA: hypothetical protein VFV59_03545 [Candidatus Limnocylindria bacterium]|nr:hypothetical protein [Candidatus Limnocylindria bacterium]
MQDEYVTFSAAWFTLALINAGIAQGKERSGFNWWLLSLFFGPLATLLLVLSGRGDPRRTESDSAGLTDRQARVLGVVLGVAVLALLGIFAFAVR